MISFSCARCGMKLSVKPEFAGRSSRCPTCKHPLVVPPPDKTQGLPSAPIDGTPSSLARVKVEGGVLLDADPARNARSIQDFLARQPNTSERYVVEGEVARGGMGAVLRAIDCDIRREVAVKYLLDQTDARKKARFVEEAQITGQLEHPNIVPIHELGVDAQKRLFFSMKMVQGRSLAQVLDELRQQPKTAEKEYSLGRLLNVLVNVCHALAYAHARGVVHRDLKPANIMLGDFGEVYVMDWGLAKVLRGQRLSDQAPSVTVVALPNSKVETSREPEADLTQEGAVLGTPVYMSPEQASGHVHLVDARSDVYALGAILYEMLTLQPPVDREGGYLAILMRVMQGEVSPPEQRSPERARAGKIPAELSAIARKSLALQPEQRYPSVEALRQDIERFQEGRSVSAKDDTFREALWKLLKRNRGASITGLVALLVITLVLGISVRSLYRAYQSLREEKDAKLSRGKQSAPLFFNDARRSANQGNIDYGLAQVGVALEYDENLDGARLLRAQLLIASKDYTRAAADLEDYLRREPGDTPAAELLALCRKARPDDARDSAALGDLLQRQGMYTLAEHLEEDRKKLHGRYRQRIDAAWPGLGKRLTVDGDGRCTLNLEGCREVSDLDPLRGMPLRGLSLADGPQVRDLSPLEEMPLNALNLRGCSLVRDLTPLQKIPLTSLVLDNCTAIRDLAVLRGLKLRFLNMVHCPVCDLSPLSDMPLESLNMHGCREISDLTPLRKLPLRHLDIGFCLQVRDLEDLKGMTLTSLNLNGCQQITYLGPLRGMRLRWLNLYGCGALDLTHLQGMDLTEIHITPRKGMQGLSLLLTMPSLKKIYAPQGTFTPADFVRRFELGEFK